MKISILICTIVGREKELERLLSVLKPQLTKDVQVLTLKDNKEISVGAKRQRLLEAATGEYICFIDDDDLVSKDYVSEILKAIKKKPDCIGFEIHCTIDGVVSNAKASKIYSKWAENLDGYKYNRSIYHKTPVKRDIALKAGFNDMRYAEDYDYSMRVMPLLKTEVFIPKQLYFYQRTDNIPHNKRYGIGQ